MKFVCVKLYHGPYVVFSKVNRKAWSLFTETENAMRLVG